MRDVSLRSALPRDKPMRDLLYSSQASYTKENTQQNAPLCLKPRPQNKILLFFTRTMFKLFSVFYGFVQQKL